MPTQDAVSDAAVEGTADERWAVWVARGAAQRKKSEKRLAVAVVAIGSGFGVWLATALTRG